MTVQQICPNCRSTFEINGSLDFGVKSLQTINCPVCGQGIWIPSGLWPQRWTVGQIITRVDPITPPVIIPPPPANDPVWSNLTLSLPGQDQLAALGKGLYNVGIWVAVVLVLIFLIKDHK